MITDIVVVLGSALFYSATVFLVAAGLQVVYGVQKVVNLACGSFFVLGAYTGSTFVKVAQDLGLHPILSFLPLIVAGFSLFFVGLIVERGLLNFVYKQNAHFQFLLTFAIALMLDDVIKFIWGHAPRVVSGVYTAYGRIDLFGAAIPGYNLVVILSSCIIAVLIGYMFSRTRFGKIVRAAAENRYMANALGVNMNVVFAKVFTMGTVLGTLGGALVIPSRAAMPDMGWELMMMSFAVITIGGLGTMKGAFFGSLLVGIIRSIAIFTFPKVELLVVYVVVIGVLSFRPQGLFVKMD
ncbi:MAG: branched-chain amino acid ABC transporter permease [Thermodesulfobacteriota bacterium]|jgi:branched-chain amino acid transport system permease protein